MRRAFIDTLVEGARTDERVWLIVADLGFSVLEEFRKAYPDRFINVGIAEQNAVGVAAGLALSGKMPYFYSIVPFVTMRCFEQVRNDVAYMRTNVRLVGIGGGLTYGAAGPTHHAIEDIAILRALPGMTVCCPGDPHEVQELMVRSFEHEGPMYLRLGKSGERHVHAPGTKIALGQAVQLIDGTDVAIITTGNVLDVGKDAVDRLAGKGIFAALISMPTVKPLDVAPIKKLIDAGTPMVTLEEHNIKGGLGSAVSEVIAEAGKGVKFIRIGIPDEYSRYVGSQEFMRRKFGLDADTVVAKVSRLLRRESPPWDPTGLRRKCL